MKIQNLTSKPIGFGSVIVLPDEIQNLPKGYDSTHPVVSYYFSRGWIKDAETIENTTDQDAKDSGVEDSGVEDSGVDENEAEADKEITTQKPTKSLDRMNKEDLLNLALAKGVLVSENDTKQAIIDKIKEKMEE